MTHPQSLKDRRAELLAEPNLTGSAFCHSYATLVDGWFSELVGDEAGVALLAVGGYGRGELCPGSDIDVVLLHQGRRDIAAVAERLWYPLWDAGLTLGHSVRTAKEALSVGINELEGATAMLTARHVAGDAALATTVIDQAAGQWRKRGTRWLAELGRSVQDRHAAAGEVAFLLEPDLKEGRGGLRDMHAIWWAEAAHHIALPTDDGALAEAYESILAIRVELQRTTGRSSNQLLLQDQDAVARACGDPDADALMGRLAAAARAIAWASDETWWRVGAALAGPSGRVVARDRQLADGVVSRDGVVELDPDADVAVDPALVLRVAAAAAATASRISRTALDRLAARSPAMGDPWPEGAGAALVDLLLAGRAAIPVLEAIDQRGLLVRILPEWEPVRSRPQRNAYHRFTVDRHLCEAAAEAAGLAGRVSRPDLLVLGAWLHDIGKGRPGDHTEVGVEIMRTVGARIGLSPEDVAILVKMVEHHLLLADTATRRDLDDPQTVAMVAEAVGDAISLDLLHALTEADSLATGPAAWGSWKAGLVADLVERTHQRLQGGVDLLPVGARSEEDDHLVGLIERSRKDAALVVELGGNHVALASPDRPGLFSRVAGTLSLHGLNVLGARVWSTDDGYAAEWFDVEPSFGPPDWPAVEADLRRALAGRISLEARLARRADAYRRSRPRAATPARTAVTVDNDASQSATVVDVRAPDAMGSLYRITRAMADMDLDIRHAKVSTLGHEVVDAFYVVDSHGAKVVDGDHIAELEAAILVELGRA